MGGAIPPSSKVRVGRRELGSKKFKIKRRTRRIVEIVSFRASVEEPLVDDDARCMRHVHVRGCGGTVYDTIKEGAWDPGAIAARRSIRFFEDAVA
jgi:hypothetical protein